MAIRYHLEITDPHTHYCKVTLKAKKLEGKNETIFFLPSWSPGSYFMREYSRNIRNLVVQNAKGEYLYFEQTAKGMWRIDWEKSETKNKTDEFQVSYEVYCHEISVRTSYIDDSHAFLHGPSLFMGIIGNNDEPELSLKFPPAWSKVSTGLHDISKKREEFLYSAKNYDEFIDAPIEIGCHETDGFTVGGKEHHLAFYGETYPHSHNLKADIKKIVDYISNYMGDIPYEKYQFITHFLPNYYGGLEHLNSTALHFDGRKISQRKDYLQWLCLVSHEYFHTWNVKRIRPKELGPFDYVNENYTSMLWLAEGLTSFMDELFVYQAGLCTLEEYLQMQKDNLNKYYAIPGRKFQSLEESSFNAWIKLYRPDENSNNSSISYYLKGGLVFSILHFELLKNKKTIKDFIDVLWQQYKKNPEAGITTEEVLDIIGKLAGEQAQQIFSKYVSTTEEIDFEKYYSEIGINFIWEESERAFLGAQFEAKGERVFIKSVLLDSPAHKSGLNANDELIAINGQRFLSADMMEFPKYLIAGKNYHFTVFRLNELKTISCLLEKEPRSLKLLQVSDAKKAQTSFQA